MPGQFKILFCFFLVLLSACSPQPSSAQRAQSLSQSSCTAPPALVDNWKKEVRREQGAPERMSDDDLERYVAVLRSDRIKDLKNPFEDLGTMSDAQRTAAKERVLWESPNVMVVVDRFNPPPKVLVVPKTNGVWVPTDADQSLLNELAAVAAAASDAIQAAVYKKCEPASTDIHINGPQEIAVQQLHIHVYLTKAWTAAVSEGELTDQIAGNLRARLGARRR